MENKTTQCRECGSQGKESKSLLNTLLSFNDFGNDSGRRGTTQARVGPVKLVDSIKCVSCGHSWIPE
jgi:DNA-directed RNA polymerase subunit M/transcription elongation factor TFIIS